MRKKMMSEVADIDVLYNPNKHELHLFCSDENYQKFMQKSEEFKKQTKNQSNNEEKKQGENVCPLCCEEKTLRYYLANCQHGHCRDCLTEQIVAQTEI